MYGLKTDNLNSQVQFSGSGSQFSGSIQFLFTITEYINNNMQIKR